MKKTLLLSLLLLLPCLTIAQLTVQPALINDPALPLWAKEMYSSNPNVFVVEKLYSEFYATHPFEKTRHTGYYKHWKKFVQPYVKEDGTIHIPDANQRNSMKQRRTAFKGPGLRTGGPWSFAGPEKQYNIRFNPGDSIVQISWQANVYCIDQSSSNPDVLYAGCENGGIYKSVNKGLTWQYKSLQEDMTSVSAIAVHPTNENDIIACSDYISYRSIDGGDTWTVINDLNNEIVWQFQHNPDNPQIVFAATSNGLERSTDGGATWVNVVAGGCMSLAHKPGQSDIVYALIHDAVTNISYMHKSIDSGLTFTIKPNGWFTVPPADSGLIESLGGRIAITAADPNRVYVLLVGESQSTASLTLNGLIGIYRSDDNGENWTHPHNLIGAPYNVVTHPNMMTFSGDNSTYSQIYYNTALAVSQLDADRIIIGGMSMWRSDDGGISYQPVGGYTGNVPRIHPDAQEFKIYKTSPTTEEFWFTTDGGINYSTDFVSTHESRCIGIYGSAFWGYDQGWNDDIRVGGRYHNGNAGRRDGFPAGEFIALGGGEAPTGYVNPSNEKKTYFSDIDGIIIPDTMNGLAQRFSAAVFPNESYADNSSSRVLFDQDYWNIAYLGYQNTIYKSYNGGNSYSVLNNFGTSIGDKVLWIEQSRSNPDVIYVQQVVSLESKIWKTTDRGVTWNQITLPQNRREMNFTVSANNANELWVCYPKGANGTKVYHTLDGGVTWTNLTTAILDDLEIEAMVHQYGTDGGVYLGTYHGPVFYRNTTMTDWDVLGTDLPYISYPLRLVPFYRDNKLRLATWHLGLWENDLYEPSALIADFSSNYDAFYCPGDTMKFIPRSVASAGATYQWIFPGGNPAASTQMYPYTVYSTGGAYDVTLIVTDGANVDTITKTNFITNIANSTIPVSETFEAGSVPYDWKQKGQASGFTNWKVISNNGGFGQSSGCLQNDNWRYDASGAHDAVWTAKYDFSNIANARLTFDVAYAQYSNTYSDSLEILASTDCGATFTSLYLKGGATLATAPQNNTAPFVPGPSEWRTDTIDVSAFAGNAEVLFSFENIGRYGQLLHIDNINVSATFTGLEEVKDNFSFDLYPNPTGDLITLTSSTRLFSNDDIISIIEAGGKEVKRLPAPANASQFTLSLRDLKPGMYFVKVGNVAKRVVR